MAIIPPRTIDQNTQIFGYGKTVPAGMRADLLIVCRSFLPTVYLSRMGMHFNHPTDDSIRLRFGIGLVFA